MEIHSRWISEALPLIKIVICDCWSFNFNHNHGNKQVREEHHAGHSHSSKDNSSLGKVSNCPQLQWDAVTFKVDVICTVEQVWLSHAVCFEE
uniref:Uncharacterized protein n=1 Tax=Eutreptiella gymnastica TaxID=73025 RepID=A0A7S1NK40_9EUGL